MPSGPMTRWPARIHATLKPGVNDPEGLSIGQALHQLGFDAVQSVRAGKYFDVELMAASEQAAAATAEEICRRLLANPVIEDYQYTVHECMSA